MTTKEKQTNLNDEVASESSQVKLSRIKQNENGDEYFNFDPSNKNDAKLTDSSTIEIKTVTFYKKLFAEFIGTGLLTMLICGIGLPIVEASVPALNGCLGCGLIVSTIVWVFGNVSGAHLNPAVTISFLIMRKISALVGIFYILIQCLGAYFGAYWLNLLSPTKQGKLSTTLVHPDITLYQAFGIEMFITFILVLTVFACIDTRRADLGGSFPLQIGMSVTVGALFGGQFTGASMNPARSFGPAAVLGLWTNHWLYWVAPISGAILAAIMYEFMLTQNKTCC